MNLKYSDEQREFIKTNAPLMSDEKLTAAFNALFGANKKIDAIKKLRQRMGIDRGKHKGVG